MIPAIVKSIKDREYREQRYTERCRNRFINRDKEAFITEYRNRYGIFAIPSSWIISIIEKYAALRFDKGIQSKLF